MIINPVVHIIAAILDHPSVFMGGPSQQSIRKAERMIDALQSSGYKIVSEKDAERYMHLAKAICRMQGIDPDELISDHGHEAWELLGYETVQQEMHDSDKYRSR